MREQVWVAGFRDVICGLVRRREEGRTRTARAGFAMLGPARALYTPEAR